MARLSYMQRRASGIYEFRKRLPTDLAGKEAPRPVREAYPELVNPKTGRFKGELVRSLGTNDEREAKRRDLRQAHEVQGAIDAASAVVKSLAEHPAPVQVPSAGGTRTSRAELSADEVAAIEAETFAELLARDEEEREGDDRRVFQSAAERAQWPDLVPIPEPWVKGMAEDHAHVYGKEAEEMAAEFRAAYARRDPGIVRGETIEALRRRGVPIDRTSSAFYQAGIAVLRGTVKAYDAILRRQRGEIVDTPPFSAEPPRSMPAAFGHSPSATQGSPKLSEAFALWQRGNPATGAKRPAPRTIMEATAAVRWFAELHGDMRIGDITKARGREFQRALVKVPSRLPESMRSLTLKQLLARGDLESYGPPRNATTINKSFNMLGAIVSYAQREGLLDHVPGFVQPFGRDVKLRVDKRTEEGREPFQPSDLAAIFKDSGVYARGDRPRAGAGEAAFWLPLIALLSGMRLEEIAGLRVKDLRQDEDTGAWLFDVTPEAGRMVKTASSIRKVPVHPELARIGLLRYHQSLIDRGAKLDDPLFSGIKSAKGRPLSAAWSKWFGRYLREKAGIRDPRLVFHSFRHTFKRMARDAGIPEELHDAMTGHAGGGGVGKSYGRGVSLRPLVDAMATIKAPDAVVRLEWRAE